MDTSTNSTSTSMTTETGISENKDNNSNAHSNFPSLNFSSGESAFRLHSTISQEELQQAREKIRVDMQKGKDLKATLKQSKKLSAGVVFKSGSLRLGKTVFDIHKENMDEKVKNARDKMRKEEQMYKINVQNAKEVFEKNIPIENMTIKQLTVICKQYKRKEDGKMPNKKDELIKKYKEWSGRPAPIFDNADVDLTSIVDAGNDDEIDIDNNYDIVAM